MKFIKNVAVILPIFLLWAAGGCATSPDASEPSTEQARKYAIDYDTYKAEAFASDAAARRFMMLSHCGIFDGAGSEGYAWNLGRLAEHFGDVHFVEILMSMENPVQKDVLKMVVYDAGWGNSETIFHDYCRRFPLTAGRMVRLEVVKESDVNGNAGATTQSRGP